MAEGRQVPAVHLVWVPFAMPGREIRPCGRYEAVAIEQDGGAEVRVTVSTAGGHHVVLDDQTNSVELRHSNGSVITIDAAGRVVILANAGVEITAPAVRVHAATTTFDGIVNCQTLIASAGVVSPSYTPGAGNLM